MDTPRTGADGREAHRIATKVFDTLLLDQITRSDSLNASAGVLAGLGGVVTTLAGVVPHLTTKNLGRLGVAGAGLSVVLAVVALILRRPGREPRQPQELLAEILASDDAQLTEDVLLRADAAAAERNDVRLRHKAQWVVGAASTLAASVLLLVTGMIREGESMHEHHATTEEQQTAREPSMWSRAFEEMRRVRNTEQRPDPDVFRDLTKSAGGD